MKYVGYCHPIWVVCDDCGATRGHLCELGFRPPTLTEFCEARYERARRTAEWATRRQPERQDVIRTHREFDVREGEKLREWLREFGDVLYTQTLKGEENE